MSERRVPLTVRLNPDDKQQLERAAADAGLDAGTVARLTVESFLKRLRATDQPSLLATLAELER